VNLGKTWLTTPTSTLGLDRNMLGTSNSQVQEFLNRYNPSSLNTQTVPPTNVQVKNVKDTSVELAWTTPVYNFDPGDYEVRVMNQLSGASEIHTIANDKQVITGTVSNLCPGTSYSFAPRTHTAPHGDQQNDLRSDFSPEAPATTTLRDLKLLAIYMLAFDNDLDSEYEPLFSALEAATAQDTSKMALSLADRNDAADTQVLSVECGQRKVRSDFPRY
jgi:hypothetical protein